MNYLRAGLEAVRGSEIGMDGARVRVPGPLAVRLSSVFGNRRIHRLMDPFLTPGAVVVDVGANIGVNTVYMAVRVGPRGRVWAVEPAADNLTVLRENVERNTLGNVTIAPVAAGRASETRQFFLRGDISAVNSFYEESVYAEVTDVVKVQSEPLDMLVEGNVDLVKIDVEGAELDVLGGMTRLLRSPRMHLVVEWHPLLQEKAGYVAEALPLALLDMGFDLQGASHSSVKQVTRHNVQTFVEQLKRSGRPVDLLATRAS